MELTDITVEGTEPAAIKPKRTRNRSGTSTRTRTRKPAATKETTTVKVQAPRKPAAAVTAAQAKVGRATLAATIAKGVKHGCSGIGLITELPAVWELAPAEVAQVEQLSTDAVALMSTGAVDPASLAGRLLAISERYAAPGAIVIGFGKLFGARAYMTYQASRNPAIRAMLQPNEDTPESAAGAAWANGAASYQRVNTPDEDRIERDWLASAVRGDEPLEATG